MTCAVTLQDKDKTAHGYMYQMTINRVCKVPGEVHLVNVFIVF